MAQAQKRQLARERRDDLAGFRIAQPGLLGERLDMDIGEAQRGQFRHAPVARPRRRGAAGRTRADLGGQRFQHLPGGVVMQGLYHAIAPPSGDRP